MSIRDELSKSIAGLSEPEAEAKLQALVDADKDGKLLEFSIHADLSSPEMGTNYQAALYWPPFTGVLPQHSSVSLYSVDEAPVARADLGLLWSQVKNLHAQLTHQTSAFAELAHRTEYLYRQLNSERRNRHHLQRRVLELQLSDTEKKLLQSVLTTFTEHRVQTMMLLSLIEGVLGNAQLENQKKIQQQMIESHLSTWSAKFTINLSPDQTELLVKLWMSEDARLLVSVIAPNFDDERSLNFDDEVDET
ncbi:MAG: hypothetical protein ACOZQL_19870 [Myxococcota bacterium]